MLAIMLRKLGDNRAPVVYYARAAQAFSAGINCQHCRSMACLVGEKMVWVQMECLRPVACICSLLGDVCHALLSQVAQHGRASMEAPASHDSPQSSPLLNPISLPTAFL